jgi:hypothetical protein
MGRTAGYTSRLSRTTPLYCLRAAVVRFIFLLFEAAHHPCFCLVGVTFTLPLLLDLAQGLKTGGAACKHVEFVAAVRERGASSLLYITRWTIDQQS